MATFKFFAGETQLTNVCLRGTGKGVLAGIDPSNPPTWDGTKWIGYVNVERTIKYKSFPSKHECDARCMNATGRTMNCECSCGGRNHGRGSISCEAA